MKEDSDMTIQYPVFVRAKDDGKIRMILEDRQSSWNYYEQIDVEDDNYEAWDAQGKPLQLAWDDQKGTRPVMTSAIPETGRLSAVLLEYARRVAPRVSGKENLSDNDFVSFYRAIAVCAEKESVFGRIVELIRKIWH